MRGGLGNPSDEVKTDGLHLYLARSGRLLIYDAADLAPESETRLGGSGGEILVDGDRVVALSEQWGAPAEAFDGVDADRLRRQGKTVIDVFDVGDRRHPVLLRRSDVEGQLLAARLAGGTLRAAVPFEPILNVSAGAEPAPDAPSSAPAGTARQGLTDPGAAWRDALAATTIDDWIPWT